LCLILRRIYADKDAQEWIIRRSRLDWTIVRPTILTDGRRTGAYRVLVDARDWRSGFISRADVGGLPCQSGQRCKPRSQDSSADRVTARVRSAKGASRIALEQGHSTSCPTRGRLGRNRVLRFDGAF